MKPIEFPGVNKIYGASQPQYLPLPVMQLPGEEGITYSCWELTDEEVERIVKSKKIFLKQLTFCQALQPLKPIVDLADDLEFY